MLWPGFSVRRRWFLDGIGLEVLHNSWTALLDLLLSLDCATAIDEMACLKAEGFGDSHARGGKQDLRNLLPCLRQ